MVLIQALPENVGISVELENPNVLKDTEQIPIRENMSPSDELLFIVLVRDFHREVTRPKFLEGYFPPMHQLSS